MIGTKWQSGSIVDSPFPPSPLQEWSARLGSANQRILIKRDDLLPFPLAGNKVRKLHRELHGTSLVGRVVITVGAATSNHCRTTAIMCRERGGRAHLVLHGNADAHSTRVALSFYDNLGVQYTLTTPADIASAVGLLQRHYGSTARFIAGGCHTPAGVEAYSDAVVELADQVVSEPDVMMVACGTGATQAGLIAGCANLGWNTQVLGVSVAREEDRAIESVREALNWAVSGPIADISITDAYRAGGYGMVDSRIRGAVSRGYAVGLPVDQTYMGKVLAAYFDLNHDGALGESVLIWHTGGFGNALYDLVDAPFSPL